MAQTIVVPLVPPQEPSPTEHFRKEYARKSRRRRGVWPPYDVLLAAFTEMPFGWREIAQRFGLSEDQISRAYREDFREVLGRSGTARRRELTKERHHDALRDAPTHDATLGMVTRSAQKSGAVVTRVLYKGVECATRRRALLINGHRCMVHVLHARIPRSRKRKHPKAQATLLRHEVNSYAAHIFWVRGRVWHANGLAKTISRMFVLPSYVLLRGVSLSPDAPANLGLWVPLTNVPVYRNCHSRINWFKYEKAWHLLEAE